VFCSCSCNRFSGSSLCFCLRLLAWDARCDADERFNLGIPMLSPTFEFSGISHFHNDVNGTTMAMYTWLMNFSVKNVYAKKFDFRKKKPNATNWIWTHELLIASQTLYPLIWFPCGFQWNVALLFSTPSRSTRFAERTEARVNSR